MLSNALKIAVSILLLMTCDAAAGASQWEYIGSSRFGGCAARRSGKDLDTMLVLDKNGDPILIAGKRNWKISGSIMVGFRIDQRPAEQMEATSFNNLILVHIASKEMLTELVPAKQIYWYLPWGDYSTDVTGMSDVLRQLRDCRTGDPTK